MRVLVVDNFDSFVFNLVQYIGVLGIETTVLRNDESLATLKATTPDAVVISPGPGKPEEAGVCVDAILEFGKRIPVLGVCLGHQAIGVAFGAVVSRAPEILHGKTSEITHDGTGVLLGLPNPFAAARYHSLAIEPGSVPSSLEVTARSESGVIMGVRHVEGLIEGVQFHPESVMTDVGMQIMRNFLSDR